MRLRFSFFTGLLAVLFFSISINAQDETLHHYCGTQHIDDEFLDYYFANRDKFYREYSPTYYIPLAVRLLGDNSGIGYFSFPEVMDAICQLNRDFSSTDLEFFLGYIDSIPNDEWYNHEEYGPGVEMMRQSNISGMVNSYIVGDPAGNCGYYASQGNAVALKKSCTGPNDHTWAHELGHFFSLPHTFRGWEGIDYEYRTPTSEYSNQVRRTIEKVDDPNCSSAADRFCDTPADYLSFRWGCDSNSMSLAPLKDVNDVDFNADGTLFMSYSLDNCGSRFSWEQVDAMRANIEVRRSNLINLEPQHLQIENQEFVGNYPLDSTTIPHRDILFDWDDVENADAYYVEVSRTPFFTYIVAKDIVYESEFLVDSLKGWHSLLLALSPVQ